MPGRAILILGLILIALSARPLFLMAREIVVGSRVTSQYEWVPSAVSNIDSALNATLNGHRVELFDDVAATDDRSLEVQAPVRILIDGRDYSQPSPVRIRPGFSTPNRYHGYVFLARILDKHAGREFVVVAQNLRSGYRILWVDADGRVTEDVFTSSDLCTVPVRAYIANHVTSHPIGFCSEIMTVWPSLFFPILYPWVSGALGLLLTLIGGVRFWRHRRSVAT